MFNRPPFWLGLLLGGLASFGAQRCWLPPRSGRLDPLFDLVSDAVLICNSSGIVTGMNAAARVLFGPDGVWLSRLCYPSGQPVPPGQLPINRLLRTGKPTGGAGYRCVSAEGKTRILDIQARPLRGGGRAVVTARDRTEIEEGRAREAAQSKREQVLRALCRRLGAAPDVGQSAQALAESALALAASLPDVRARLYTYDGDAKRLTRLASAPDDRPNRPKSHRQAQRPTFPFDASSPLLWSVYVAREPAVGADVGDEAAGPAYALPLLAGGAALGHLSLTCPAADAFADPDLRETLGLLASISALALAGPRQAAQAAHLAAQMEALRAVIRAVAERTEPGALADMVSREVRRVLGAEVCTLALKDEAGLRLVGHDYRDALLFPDRHAPDDSALTGDTAREAVRKGKTIQRTGRTNPSFEAGVWRAVAGQSGRHCVVSVPLAAGQGALTVQTAGDVPLSDAQVEFLETLAVLVSVRLPEASLPAERTDL